MGAATLINLVLLLLSSILESAKVGGMAPELIANVEAAIASLTKVIGTPVTYQQLESLRVKTTW